MNSPLPARVKVDAQGRMVLPRGIRDDLLVVPGEVLVRRTAEGVLLTAAESAGAVSEAADGLPVLRIGRSVSNDEVLAAIDRERADR
jgi:bifunctional DNA-binding transcriptional regulator/antitoxin component of YhaV-PrlF toxin-antitoxin module